MDAAALGTLSGLTLVRDEAGADATFAVVALVRAAQAQGLKVVFAAAADTPAHYEAALRKAAAAAGPAARHGGGTNHPPPPPPPPITWVPLIEAEPDLWSRGGGGLGVAGDAIQAAVEEAGTPEGVCLVLDSLDALHDASPSPAAWRAFLASSACLACPAAAVVARVSCGWSAEAGGSHNQPTWLPALAAAASLVLTAAPLPSGAAAGVDGTLALDRRAAAGATTTGSAAASPLGRTVFHFWGAPVGGVRLVERGGGGGGGGPR